MLKAKKSIRLLMSSTVMNIISSNDSESPEGLTTPLFSSTYADMSADQFVPPGKNDVMTAAQPFSHLHRIFMKVPHGYQVIPLLLVLHDYRCDHQAFLVNIYEEAFLAIGAPNKDIEGDLVVSFPIFLRVLGSILHGANYSM